MSFVARWVGALAFVGCSFVGVARADEGAAAASTEPAEIQLKNGSTMRGTIVNVEPGQRVIVIVAGEQSVIPWSDIAKIVGGPQEPAAPAAPAAPAVPTAPTKGMPLVHIESNWPEVELARIDGDIGGGYQHHEMEGFVSAGAISKYVCRAPCDKLVDGRDGHRFFIKGSGMFPSPPFRLDTFDGSVTARVTGTSMSRFTGGVVLAALGGTLTLGGGMFTAFSFLIDPEKTAENPNPEGELRTVRTFGLVLLGMGVASLVGGIVFLSEGRTRIELVPARGRSTGVVLDKGVLRF